MDEFGLPVAVGPERSAELRPRDIGNNNINSLYRQDHQLDEVMA